MKDNIKAIKYLGVFTIIFAVLTYLASVNAAENYVSLISPWFTNEFLLTICGGVFASFAVVLLCEIQKYKSNKRSCQDYIFYQTMYLYIAFYLMHRNIQDYLQRKDIPVPENLFDINSQNAKFRVNALQSVDYVTFCQKNKLSAQYKNFQTEILTSLQSKIHYGTTLRIALNNQKIETMLQKELAVNLTPANSDIYDVLCQIGTDIQNILNILDSQLKCFDCLCNMHYNWKAQRDKICNSYKNIFEFL